MRLLTTIGLSLLALNIANAKTTMCFKQNHQNMSTIETVKLDGGACASKFSLKQMKENGWSVEDIKISSKDNSNDYIYILKKDEINLSNINEEALEQKILQRLENRKKEENRIKKEQLFIRKSKSGEALYKNKCVSCHGQKGELEARGTSRAIKDLNLDDFTLAIRDYNLGNYDRGQAFIMKPYANLMTQKDIKNVYIYLKSINQKKEVTK